MLHLFDGFWGDGGANWPCELRDSVKPSARISIQRIPTFQNRLDYSPEGKLSLPLDLRNPKSQLLIRKLIKTADVLVESLRPGNMEKYGLGPDDLRKINPRLIYARLVGYGQTGPYKFKSGHDGNFAALCGLLPMLGDADNPIRYPSLMMSYSSSALLCAFAILSAVIARQRIGVGQVIDHATSEAMGYAATAFYRSAGSDIWYRGARRFNLDIYETFDGRFMMVMAYERVFFEALKKALGLENDAELTLSSPHQWAGEKLAKVFRTKTQAQWVAVFKEVDACVTPVLDANEAMEDEHNKFRNNFTRLNGKVIPNPAPKLDRTPATNGAAAKPELSGRDQVRRVLEMIQVDGDELEKLISDGVILLNPKEKA